MYKFKLKNNVVVLFEETEGAQVFSLQVFSSIAPISDSIDKAGLSNLTMQLMQKATINRNKEVLAKDIDDIGADLSYSLSYNYCALNINSLSLYFQKAAHILSDIIINPAFSKEELEFERKNLKAVLKSSQDEIKVVAIENFSKNFYASTPYQYTPFGSLDTIDSITLDDIKKEHGFAYSASNILISIAGNLKPDFVKEVLEELFGDIKGGQSFIKPSFALKSFEQSEKIIDSKFNQAFIMRGFCAPPLNDKDFAAASVLCAILGGAMTSRLFIELREKLGLAYEVSALYPARTNMSHFAVYIGLDKKNINLTLKRIDGILQEFCIKGTQEEELKNVKKYIKGTYALSRLTAGSKADFYGIREMLWGDYKYDSIFLSEIEAVSCGAVLTIANRIFKNKSFTIILKPK